jgi:uncharacterized tannase-like protein DUF6351
MRRAPVFVVALAFAFVAAPQGSSGASDRRALVAAGNLEILVLSNRADLISGGDALVEIVGAGPPSSKQRVRVEINGRDVTGSFAIRGDGRLLGLVEGLKLGKNVLTARKPGARGARLTITNHPIGGSIISGAQVEPWLCTTQNNGLGPAQDAQCNAPTVYQLFYRTTSGTFAPYDPANPPSDVAMTTTDEGRTVPYIFRQETGTQNRGIYRIAVLTDPARPWEAWSPQFQPGWNHKLFYPFGASCGSVHSQSSAQNVQDDRALSRGFMVATSSLNVLGNNCNPLTSAESAMMLKERIAERYGPIRYTFASGCSGGSIMQHEVANAYPGLLQGIQPNCSYEDMWSGAFVEIYDCHLLMRYYTMGSPQFAAAEMAAVNGQQNPAPCELWDFSFGTFQEPENGCGIPAGEMYNAQTNPTGCRGTFQDFNMSVFGKRPPNLWIPPEQIAGGFAKVPFDNVGVQYGLKALQALQITPEQFVDLNEKIGGVDIDYNFIPERAVADPGAVGITHRSGRSQDASQLDKVAIIDLRATSNTADIHTDYHSYSLQERLEKANGHADNQIIWTWANPTGILGIGAPPAIANESFLLLDRWLAAVEADSSSDALEVKIVRNKPQEAVSACWLDSQGTGPKVTDPTVCRAAFPYYANPRIAAGEPFTNDVLKCQLKPLDPLDPDYRMLAVPFTPMQWARLQATFPTGVCDWTKPGVDQVPSVPWLTYSNGPGGQPLGPPPVSTPF